MITKEERQEKTREKIEEIKEICKGIKRKGHLTLEEREIITLLKSKNYSGRQIAKIIGRNPSTISRELKRKETINNFV